jgi:uncharacterized protein (TIGR02117 family)
VGHGIFAAVLERRPLPVYPYDMLKLFARRVVLLALAVLGLCVAYVLVALVFALLPLPGRLQEAGDEPPVFVFVCASLAHTDIVVPSRDPLMDWRILFPAAAPPGLPPQAFLAFGWGDLRFFRETPAWSDVRPSTALGALAGLHDTALRVVAVNPPDGNPNCLKLAIDRKGRQALVDYIRDTLQPDDAGEPQWQPGGTEGEAYYLAKGRYGPLRTCNQWTAEALGAAGLPHAYFAPFGFGVTWPASKAAR